MFNTNNFQKSNLDNDSKYFMDWYNIIESQSSKKISVSIIKKYLMSGKNKKNTIRVYDENHPLYKYNNKCIRKEELINLLLDSFEDGSFKFWFNTSYPLLNDIENYPYKSNTTNLQNINMLINNSNGSIILLYILLTNYYNNLLNMYVEV